jgi:tripartite motif-containing protein 2/3
VLFVDKEVGEMNKQPLVQCIKAAKKRMDKMSSAVRDIDDRLFTLHEEGNRCKEDIAEMKDRMIEAVTNRCAVLVSEVEEAEEKRRRDLEEHKKTLQDQMKQLEHFKSSAEDIVYDGTTREQLSVRKAMIQRASTLTSTPIPPPPPSSSSIHFVSEKREEAEKILSQVGRLSLGADPETSTMEGLTIANNTVECRPWNVPLMLKVVTRDHSGSQCAFGGENVVSVLTPTTCGVPVLGKVEDNGDGTYQVIFVSVPSEECELSVTVNGVHMKGSPVNVKMCYPNTIKQEIRGDKERRFRALVYTKQGTLLATDNKNKEVCTFAKNGEMLNSFKVQDPGGNVDGIASLSDGNIAVSLYSRNCIAVYRPNGELVKEFGSDRLNGPSGLAVNNKGQLFVAEYQGHRVSVYSENGEFQYSFGSRGSQPGEFVCPDHLCIGQDGLLYVSDRDNHRIQVFQQDGRFVRQFGKDVLTSPNGVALTKDGHIVVASESVNKLSIFSPSGECVHEVKDVGLKNPYGVAVTDDGFIFVADSGNGRIVKL